MQKYGLARTENPRVGGSIPSLATNSIHNINILELPLSDFAILRTVSRTH